MQWLGLGVFMGIAIYWAITMVMVRRVRDRHMETTSYIPILWGVEAPKEK